MKTRTTQKEIKRLVKVGAALYLANIYIGEL